MKNIENQESRKAGKGWAGTVKVSFRLSIRNRLALLRLSISTADNGALEFPVPDQMIVDGQQVPSEAPLFPAFLLS